MTFKVKHMNTLIIVYYTLLPKKTKNKTIIITNMVASKISPKYFTKNFVDMIEKYLINISCSMQFVYSRKCLYSKIIPFDITN